MPTVKTSAFLLGEATVMLTPYADETPVFELTPEKHSVGMTRNVSLSQESDTIELRKGIQQLLVDSKKSNVRSTISAEVYEYSARNLFYSLSMAKTPVDPKRGKLTATATGPQASITIESSPVPGEAASAITAATDIPVGATILLQVAGTGNDYVLPVRVTAATVAAGAEFTVSVEVPEGMEFPAGSHCWIVNEIPVGSTSEEDYFKLKVTGTLSNNERPMTIVFPKVRITQGFQLNFDESNYTSMPFQFSPYFLTQSEITGRLAEIGTSQQCMVYSAA